MAYSRVEKYQKLRDGLKDEAGIDREKLVKDEKNEEDDDFLSFIKKDEKTENDPVNLEDTLTEAKTFEQMRQEGSRELEQALRSAKKGVGKETRFNTRMDILSKIREPEKTTIKIDAVDEYKTDEFARGMFLNRDKEEDNEPVEEVLVDSKSNMTLMERLASISPEEDAKKAQEFLYEEKQEEVIKEETEINENKQTSTQEFTQLENEDSYMEIFNDEENDEEDIKKDSKIVKVLDIVIAVLVILLIILFGVIIYQSFF